VIILLSAGESPEQQTEVEQTIDAGKQLVGPVSIIAFGLDVGQQSHKITNLLNLRRRRSLSVYFRLLFTRFRAHIGLLAGVNLYLKEVWELQCMRGVGDGSLPVGVQGQSLGKGSGDEFPKKLKHF